MGVQRTNVCCYINEWILCLAFLPPIVSSSPADGPTLNAERSRLTSRVDTPGDNTHMYQVVDTGVEATKVLCTPRYVSVSSPTPFPAHLLIPECA